MGRIEDGKIRWSGSTIEARFAGSGIAVRLRHDKSIYSYRIDDRVPELLTGPTLAEHLDARTEHHLVIVRESEALAGEDQFLGFDFVPGGELLPLPEPERRRPRIEIVGDSITCGYGILGDGPECHFSLDTERATKAYGALAARKLAADLTTICWSGRGIYRNYDEPDAPTMPELWTPDPKGAPDVVVVALGTNDVLAPRDRFDPSRFERAYLAFLARIRAAYPKAPVVLGVSPMLEGVERRLLADSLANIVAARRSGGDASVDILVWEEQGKRLGCDFHPNAAMHEVMARQLVEALGPKLR